MEYIQAQRELLMQSFIAGRLVVLESLGGLEDECLLEACFNSGTDTKTPNGCDECQFALQAISVAIAPIGHSPISLYAKRQ